jgi:transcriptional antiterminator
MMLQLNPMIPIVRVSDKMKGFAFMVIDYSQEHNLLFVCGMDDGEIWTLNNKEIRFCKNVSMDRKNINYDGFIKD